MYGDPSNQSQDSNPVWATWVYTAEEWARFDEALCQQAQTQWRRAQQLAGACAMSLGIVLLLDLTWQFPLFICPVFVVFLILVGPAVQVAQQAIYMRQHRARHHEPAQVSIGPGGMTISQEYIELSRQVDWETKQSGYSLHWVRRINGEQPQIAFTLKWRGGGFFEIWIPIPAGKEAEADGVVARYGRELLGTRWSSLAVQRHTEAFERLVAPPKPLPTRPVTRPAPADHATRRLPQLRVSGVPPTQRDGNPPPTLSPPPESSVPDSPTRRLEAEEIRQPRNTP